MNKWLERALISAGAAVVSTTAIVTTAEKPGKKKKKKKKGKKGDAESSRGQDGALIDDEVPRSIGAQAAHDFRVGHDGGLTGAQFFENVRGAGQKAARSVSTLGGLLFSRQPSAPAAEGDAPPKARKKKKVRRRVRRKVGAEEPAPEGAKKTKAKKKKKRRTSAPERDDLDELRDEAAKTAARMAAKGVADKVGVGDAFEKVKEQSRELWEKTERLSASVREKVPEDLGKKIGESLEEAGSSIRDGANKLTEKVRDAVGEDDETGEDLGDRVERGIRGFVRWVEGPGAPDYEGAPKPSRVKPVSEGVDDVEPKEPPTDAAASDDDAPQA